MRSKALLLLPLLLAGCSDGKVEDPGLPPPADEEEPGEGRSSRGGSGEGPEDDIPSKDVMVFETDLQAVGPTDMTWDVTVPRGALSGHFRIVSEHLLHQDATTLDLAGCGAYSNPGISLYGSPAGTIEESGRLCSYPASGSQTLHLASGPLTFVNGRLEIYVRVPLAGNATA
jgi:hypothetical protein